jgi:Cu(I)/Ag(I) efflux system membrane fusion protein
MFANGIIKASLKNAKDALIIPKTAVLWTGKRSVVYVKVPHKNTISFVNREVNLGADLGNFYIVENGLSDGEIVATNGVFKIDASAQLIGKQSMMNPTAEKQNIGHSSMDMGDDTKMSDEEMKNMNSAETKTTISKEFQNQLNNVFNKYIGLKDALTKENATNAQKLASTLLISINKVDIKLLTNNDSQMQWMTFSKEISTSTEAISTTTDIEIQRNHFKNLSVYLIKAVKLFGINQKVFEQFCPMANDNNGAFWLSLTETINNPYFGKKMLKCGSTKSIIE